MLPYISTLDLLLLECTHDIRREFRHMRSLIQPEEIRQLARALLQQTPPQWPLALYELQNGICLQRLTSHLNGHLQRHRGSSGMRLTFKGPFPALSLKPVLSAAAEHRTTLRTAHIAEFLGNKAWDQALKAVKKSVFPVEIDVATFALETCGCSSAHLLKEALVDLSHRIRGHILNFLWDWETLLVQQTRNYLLSFAENMYLTAAEPAV